MPVAELIAIGTELLLGEIQDTNTRYLARCLRDVGVSLYRSTLIGDNAGRISALIREALERADIVITTGGLGPTVDDPTRQAVADAFGLPLLFQPLLWEQIQARFQRYGRLPTENNRRQAYIPSGARVVENQVGTAPAFIVQQAQKCVICLPGVPREMEHLLHAHVLPYLRETYHLHGIIKATVLHAAGVGESQVDEWIGDLEKLENPTVGLLAHPGQVDIRLTVKAESEAEADRALQVLAAEVRQRVGDAIYGQDDQTLESILHSKLESLSWKLAVLDCGLNGALAAAFNTSGSAVVFVKHHETACPDLLAVLRAWMSQCHAQAGVAASLVPGPDQHILTLDLITPQSEDQMTRSYGGPAGNAPAWAARTVLDSLRRRLNSIT